MRASNVHDVLYFVGGMARNDCLTGGRTDTSKNIGSETGLQPKGDL